MILVVLDLFRHCSVPSVWLITVLPVALKTVLTEVVGVAMRLKSPNVVSAVQIDRSESLHAELYAARVKRRSWETTPAQLSGTGSQLLPPDRDMIDSVVGYEEV